MKPRIKMHQLPGDVWKGEKIAMLEGRHESRERSKSFKRLVRMREKAVLKERTRLEVARELEEDTLT